jgi:hypothetical protein
MDYAAAKQIRDSLDAKTAQAGAALDAFPKLANGMTPDAVKFSAEYRSAKAIFDAAFAAQRAFNGKFVAAFRKQIQAERRARYA